MKIQDIYNQYTIMPSLQLHMLRVSAVAQLICNSFKKKLPEEIRDQVREDNLQIDTENIIAACLLHDMGNILKFNMNILPEFLEPEGKGYWQNIKDQYQEKYGIDEHDATIQIVRELRVSDRIVELVDSFHFLRAKENAQTNDFGIKICAYSDMRVEPHYIVSLEGRLEEGRQRFYQSKPELFKDTIFQDMAASLKQIENQIFKYTTITPAYITDETITPFIENLRNFELPHSK